MLFVAISSFSSHPIPISTLYDILLYVCNVTNAMAHTKKNYNNNKIWENTSKSHIQPAAMAVKIICILCCFLYSSFIFHLHYSAFFCVSSFHFPHSFAHFSCGDYGLCVYVVVSRTGGWENKKNYMKWIENEVGGKRQFFFSSLFCVFVAIE